MYQANTLRSPDVAGAWLFAGGDAWSVLIRRQGDLLGFVSQRLAKDAYAVCRLGQCRGWQEVSAVQSSWLTELLDDYVSETSKMLGHATPETAAMSRATPEPPVADQLLPQAVSPYAA
jgi:hypothetical protein